MSTLAYFHRDAIADAWAAGAWIAVGGSIGTAYFLALRWSVKLLAAGRSPLRAILLQFLRVAGMAGLLTAITVKFGALPLLGSFLGFLVARTMVVRRRKGS